MSDDVMLTATIAHLPGGVFDAVQFARIGRIVGHLEPLVGDAHTADAPDALDALIDTLVAEALPESMVTFGGLIALALRAGAAAAWHALEARRIQAEEIVIVEVP